MATQLSEHRTPSLRTASPPAPMLAPYSRPRKRPSSPPAPLDTTPTKRYLNAALAAELQSLRISSSPVTTPSPTRTAFGRPPSPFLSAPPARAHPTDVHFGHDFAAHLVQEPDVFEPRPVPVSMAFERPPGPTVYHSPDDDLVIEEFPHYDPQGVHHTVVEDDNVANRLPAGENRLTVYRPPVRTPSYAMNRLNSYLPDGRFVLRNPRTDEWVLTEVHNDRAKRKLALVPYRGDAKRQLCEPPVATSSPIPMPWKDIYAPPSDPGQSMEIEPLQDVP